MRFFVTGHDITSSSVLLFGPDGDLSRTIAATCRAHGIEAASGPEPCGGPSRASPEATPPTKSAVFILAAETTESLFGQTLSVAARRRLRSCENSICDSALAAAGADGARRVLVACDARTLSFGKRLRAERWARDLAHRIGYEGRIKRIFRPHHVLCRRRDRGRGAAAGRRDRRVASRRSAGRRTPASARGPPLISVPRA